MTTNIKYLAAEVIEKEQSRASFEVIEESQSRASSDIIKSRNRVADTEVIESIIDSKYISISSSYSSDKWSSEWKDRS